jgi:hypothetical protein
VEDVCKFEKLEFSKREGRHTERKITTERDHGNHPGSQAFSPKAAFTLLVHIS